MDNTVIFIVHTIYMHTHNALRVNDCKFLIAWSSISRRSIVHFSSIDRPFLSSLDCPFLVARLSIVARSSIDQRVKQDLVYRRLSVPATKQRRLNVTYPTFFRQFSQEQNTLYHFAASEPAICPYTFLRMQDGRNQLLSVSAFLLLCPVEFPASANQD